jgi:putative glutamine amidotransferase
MKKIVVGIVAGRKYENYVKWIKQVPEVEIIKLSHPDNNAAFVRKCNGIVLTGGEDVHPSFYRKPEYTEQFHLDDFDIARDEFELEVLANVQHHQLPLLGICRGLQITNVFFGGTLLPDIPSFGKPDHTKYEEGRDRYHSVKTEKNSLLSSIAGESGEVNSAHHQSVDLVGDGLMVNAISTDGIIEGVERKEKKRNPFLLLVQWHPERMVDQENPLSKNIRDTFIESIRKP